MSFELLIMSFIFTSTITGTFEIIQDIKMKSWTILNKANGFKLPYKEDEEFEAVIRHCNEKLKLPDKKVFLTLGSDCVYFEGSKMSWNWNIVMHRSIKRKTK